MYGCYFLSEETGSMNCIQTFTFWKHTFDCGLPTLPVVHLVRAPGEGQHFRQLWGAGAPSWRRSLCHGMSGPSPSAFPSFVILSKT